MIQFITSILSRPALASILFTLISAFALGMALMAEHVFGLLPCILCLYQRVPFVVVIGLGVLGAAIAPKFPKVTGGMIGLISLSFFFNSLIAFYHSGVERKWWISIFEMCAGPKLEGSMDDILATIQSAPVVRCDEIPWADPILGLSMANYNVPFCLGLAVIAAYSAWRIIYPIRS